MTLIAVLGATGFVILLYQAFASEGSAPEQLGAAVLISSGQQEDLDLSTLQAADYTTLDDVPLGEAVELDAASDATFLVVSRGAVTESDIQGNVINARYTDAGLTTRSATHEAGRFALMRSNILDADAPLNLTIWNTSNIEDTALYELDLRNYPDWPSDAELPLPRDLAYMPDESLLLSRPNEAGIDVLSPEESGLTHWLGQPGNAEAEVELNEPLGEIQSLVALPENRVVFTADTPRGDRELYLLDESTVERINAGPELTIDGAPPDSEMLWPIDHLSPGPGGQVITVGMVDDDFPRISLLDVDTREVEVLIDLEGVNVDVGTRVSAVAVGENLVFLANDSLWILEDAFAGTEG